MRELLKIGEMAKLLNVSTSKIRYYEKEGLIEPVTIDENGYRMYGFKELDSLEFIMLMKDINVPLKEIREIMTEGEGYDYRKTIARSIDKIDSEISQLEEKKKILARKYDDYMRYQDVTVEISYMGKRILRVLDKRDEHNKSIKDLYDFIMKKGIKYMDYNEDFYLVSKEDGDEFLAIYMKADDGSYDDLQEHVVEPGRFAGMRLTMEMDDRSFGVADILVEEAGKIGLKLKGDKLIIEELSATAYSRKKRFVTVQMRIEE